MSLSRDIQKFVIRSLFLLYLLIYFIFWTEKRFFVILKQNKS